MVMLMLGVNYIFSAVGGAAGNTNALSKLGRDIQAASTVFNNDFNGFAADGACFLINSQVQPAFVNIKDELGAKDSTLPLIDDDGNVIPVSTYNYRNHRTDIISFFSRGSFPRMTGNNGEFISDMSSTEAWIWYGHLRLANNDSSAWPRMGEQPKTSNPNNYYASQWVLGRVAMLLMDPDTDGRILDLKGAAQHYIDHQSTITPLSQGANTEEPSGPRINTSRYDLAGTSIDGYRGILEGYIKLEPTKEWWHQMMLDDAEASVDPIALSQRRFSASTFVKKPIDSAAASTQVPLFLQGCSSFIVEFAGDFFKQDPLTGSVKEWGPDGEIDYVIVPNIQFPLKSTRLVRWYGMPRDTGSPVDTSTRTDGGPDGKIKGDGPSENMVDVVPLLDVMANASPTITPPAKFIERKYPAHQANYANASELPKDFQYIAAWGPDLVDCPLPQMIRLVITQDDANGRISNGVTSEMVFKIR